MNKKALEVVMNYRPIDDDFMRIIFKDNKPLVEYVLRIVLGKADLVVETSETQADLEIFGSRGLSLDVFARDESGKRYNIEVQRSDRGATSKRARFHASAIDVTSLSKGMEFGSIPDTYVIFITENDVLEGGKLAYTIHRTVEETNKLFNDGTHIIYVNASYDDTNTDLGKLVHDFMCKNASDMLCEPMKEITKHYKETEEGVEFMCKAVEDYAKEYAKDYARKERQKERIDTIKSFIKDGSLSLEKIAEIVKLPLDDVKKIAATV